MVSGKESSKNTDPSPSAASAYEAALSTWQKSIQELLGYFYKSQIEAYRLLSNHWEQYLKLHAEISQSRSLTEFTQPVIKVRPNGAGDPNA